MLPRECKLSVFEVLEKVAIYTFQGEEIPLFAYSLSVSVKSFFM